jgi:hypothetical protein
LADKHPARPHKSAVQTRFTVGNAKGALTPGPGRTDADQAALHRLRAGRVTPAHHQPTYRSETARPGNDNSYDAFGDNRTSLP